MTLSLSNSSYQNLWLSHYRHLRDVLLPQAVHGPYDPAVFYGKKDLKLSQVKIYELPLWLMRRQFYNPIAYGRCMSRYSMTLYESYKPDTLRKL